MLEGVGNMTAGVHLAFACSVALMVSFVGKWCGNLWSYHPSAFADAFLVHFYLIICCRCISHQSYCYLGHVYGTVNGPGPHGSPIEANLCIYNAPLVRSKRPLA